MGQRREDRKEKLLYLTAVAYLTYRISLVEFEALQVSKSSI